MVGQPDAIAAARAAIASLLSEDGDAGMDSGDNVIDVPEGKMRTIIGAGGQVVKRLEEQHGVRVQAVRGGKGVVVLGDGGGVAACRDAIAALLQSERAEVSIPDGRMGAVIGKGGATVRDLEAQHNVKIDAMRSRNTLAVVGQPDAIAAARAAIDALLNEDGGSEAIRNVPRSGDVIQVPQGKMGALVGAGGTIIRRLEEHYGVRVQIVRGGTGIVVLGDGAGVASCHMAIEELLQIGKGIEQLEIPHGRMGEIIGKGGATVRMLEQKHNVRINALRDRSIVIVTGPRPAVSTAVADINALVSDDAGGDRFDAALPLAGRDEVASLNPHGLLALAGVVHDADASSNSSSAPIAQVRVVISAPQDSVRAALLGGNGAATNDIEEATGARIEPSRFGGGSVAISGTARAVAAASRRVRAMLLGEARVPLRRHHVHTLRDGGKGAVNLELVARRSGAKLVLQEGSFDEKDATEDGDCGPCIHVSGDRAAVVRYVHFNCYRVFVSFLPSTNVVSRP